MQAPGSPLSPESLFEVSRVMNPKVSIHMISYNQGQFLPEAIESALAQDYPSLEIVVADDASTDGSAEILADYGQRYPDRLIAVFGEKNLGITGNSNRALARCSGELIAIMGSDDVLMPGKISAQVAWFRADPRRVLCGHQVEVFYENGVRPPHPLTKRLRSGRGAEPFIRHGTFGALSVMVRRDRIPSHGFDEHLKTVCDQLLWVEVIGEDGLFGHVPGTLARYRRHSANVTGDPFSLLHEVDLYLRIVRERYPAFASAVRYARTRRLYYDPAVAMIALNQKKAARANLFEAIWREPWFVKSWIRLAQTYL